MYHDLMKEIHSKKYSCNSTRHEISFLVLGSSCTLQLYELTIRFVLHHIVLACITLFLSQVIILFKMMLFQRHIAHLKSASPGSFPSTDCVIWYSNIVLESRPQFYQMFVVSIWKYFYKLSLKSIWGLF